MRHCLPVAAVLLLSFFTVPVLSQTCETHCAYICNSGFLGRIRKTGEDSIARAEKPQALPTHRDEIERIVV